MTKNDYLKRIAKLQHKLKTQQSGKRKLAGLILQDTVSIFYLTGLAPSFGRILITPTKAFFFVDGRYFEALNKQSPLPVFLLKNNSFELFLKENFPSKAEFAFDSSACSYLTYEKLKEGFKKTKTAFTLKPWAHPLQELRSHKEPEEIKKLKKAAEINFAGFQHLKKLLKVGLTEAELAFEYEVFIRKKGAEKPAFDPIVAFGENSASPHHRPEKRKLQKNEIVLMDLGASFEGYASDMTRTFFFGKADARLQELYRIVQEAQNKALSFIKAGVSVEKLEELVFTFVKEAGYQDFYVHALGHGVGLDVHEFPALSRMGIDKKAVLKKGMVIAVEPGLYLPGLGGVRIEDTVEVTETGCKSFYPRDAK